MTRAQSVPCQARPAKLGPSKEHGPTLSPSTERDFAESISTDSLPGGSISTIFYGCQSLAPVDDPYLPGQESPTRLFSTKTLNFALSVRQSARRPNRAAH
jgi:hypothetical protein